jgi:hypothetical protein
VVAGNSANVAVPPLSGVPLVCELLLLLLLLLLLHAASAVTHAAATTRPPKLLLRNLIRPPFAMC